MSAPSGIMRLLPQDNGYVMGNDEQLAAVARRQHGPFTLEQAHAAGFSTAAVRRRVNAGRWLSPHNGVFFDASVPVSEDRDVSAAVLACAPRAAASYRAAARRWDLDVDLGELIDVTVVSPGRARPR